jgi:NAD-dependent dihydropyrimidine dehydrogenase PreA subunit
MRIQHPKTFSIRKKKQFLFFPKRIKNETRWLEVGIWEEIYDAHWIAINWLMIKDDFRQYLRDGMLVWKRKDSKYLCEACSKECKTKALFECPDFTPHTRYRV